MYTQHRHAYFFAVKIADYIHFVGLRYTEDTQHALWLATQVKDIIDTIEATKRVRVCAHVSDSANVCLAMHKILTGYLPETYQQHDKQELLQAKLSHPIAHIHCACHAMSLAIHDYSTVYNLKEKVQKACKQNGFKFTFCQTRWFSLDENLKDLVSADIHGFNGHYAVVDIVSIALRQMEKDNCSQVEFQQILNQIYSDLSKHGEFGKNMSKCIEDRTRKMLLFQTQIARFNKLLEHDEQEIQENECVQLLTKSLEQDLMHLQFSSSNRENCLKKLHKLHLQTNMQLYTQQFVNIQSYWKAQLCQKHIQRDYLVIWGDLLKIIIGIH
ncbi:Conserved_hypothetical protein [Hexamita inflata]|uniref:DUF4371 domain-containing protein n=1 Tax=Hexamita inflata TaxID=28002 RepID=A0ABP1HPY0_9EUKA